MKHTCKNPDLFVAIGAVLRSVPSWSNFKASSKHSGSSDSYRNDVKICARIPVFVLIYTVVGLCCCTNCSLVVLTARLPGLAGIPKRSKVICSVMVTILQVGRVV